MDNKNLQQEMSNTLRFLCTDMVQEANSGHPGAAMALSDISVILNKNLIHNPKNPNWINRDRLVFSGGHVSTLLYSLLHLWGYDVSLDDLKKFRQLGSKTAGHPEFRNIDGIEITTGPLGQGIANAVGFCTASTYLGNMLNNNQNKAIDHKVYCFCGDGDLQEGISYEALSFAGHNNFNNLVLIYDSNSITIEGDTSLAWSDDIRQRFESMNFDVIELDGHNFTEIENGFSRLEDQKKPIIIVAKTTIAKGSSSMEGSASTHGAPLGTDEIMLSKQKANMDSKKRFFIEDKIKECFNALDIGKLEEDKWNNKLTKEQKNIIKKLENVNLTSIVYPKFTAGDDVATRDSNGKILNAISQTLDGFIGGSADLAPSNKTYLNHSADFPNGKNIHFGIREHAMAAICNGISNYGLLIPFSSTFFVFSDYLKPSARIAALMGIKHYFIWTHDSIGVGEDGPTHQPIEQISQYRALPNFYLFRPADAIENVLCWKTALKMNAPCAFVLSRQKLKIFLKEDSNPDISKGAYMVQKQKNASITLMASGSEVSLAIKTSIRLEKSGILANIVSVPCFDLFIEQAKEYQNTILDKNTKILAIEASRGLEWYRFCDDLVSMDSFGESGKAEDLFAHFGFTVDAITNKALELLKK
jgi:transketolase